MVTYRLIFEETEEYEAAAYSYGILAVGEDHRIRVIRDITDDKERLLGFIDELNELSLDPIHLDEAVEDFLCNL